MKATTNRLNLNWVSEIIETQYKLWTNQDTIIIDCQTGTGKSEFIKQVLIDYATRYNKKILYLCNRTNLKQQFKKDLIENDFISLPDNIDINHISCIGCTSIKSYQEITYDLHTNNYNVSVIEYEGNYAIHKSINISEYDYIVYDECHYILQDASFNNKTDIFFFDFMKKNIGNTTSIFISATIDSMIKLIKNNLLKDNKREPIVYQTGRDYSYINDYYYKDDDDIINTINNDCTANKWIVFSDNIDKALEMKNAIKDSEFICSIKNENAKHMCMNTRQLIIDESRFDCKCLIATKAMDNGINIADDLVTNIVMITTNKIDFLQMLGRKRINIEDAQKINLYIKKRDIRTFNHYMNKPNGLLDTQSQIDEYYKDIYKFAEKYDRDHGDLKKGLFHHEQVQNNSNNVNNKWKINILGLFAHRENYFFCESMISKFKGTDQKLSNQYGMSIDKNIGSGKDENAFIKEQLSWIGKRYDKTKWIGEVMDNEEIESLTQYLDSLIGVKLFDEKQKELTSKIMNEYLTIGKGVDYRTEKVKYSTLEKILRDDLGLKYAIESKRDESRKSETYKKRYIIISKNITK